LIATLTVGTYHIITPLVVVSLVTCIPAKQKAWALGRIWQLATLSGVIDTTTKMDMNRLMKVMIDRKMIPEVPIANNGHVSRMDQLVSIQVA
jgi:hypothetical protein